MLTATESYTKAIAFTSGDKDTFSFQPLIKKLACVIEKL
jgi:hypothetical protein